MRKYESGRDDWIFFEFNRTAVKIANKTSSPNLRGLAANAIGRVCDDHDSLDVVLDELSPHLPEQQRGLFREIVYGSIRWHGAYSVRLKRYLKKPLKKKDRCLQHLLVAAMYQLDFLSVAPYAVVNESVVATRWLNRAWGKGLVNGVLRSVLRDHPDGSPGLRSSLAELRHCFPGWLVAELESHWPKQLDTILAASNQKPPMTLRVNQQRATRDQYLRTLEKANVEAIACEQSAVGVTLAQGMAVSALPGFDKGVVSVQDESAQLVAPLLALAPGQRVLDACSAPGGKTAHLLERCPELGEVVAIDFPSRLVRLNENMQRLGLQATIKEGDVTELDQWWDGQPFDRVLLDVPCTGTGVIRRHPEIRFRRQPEDITLFVTQQQALLEATWSVLRPRGLMLYSTCSILPQENEEAIAEFVSQHQDAEAKALPDWLGFNTGSGRQRLTGVHSGDGFYYALLHKRQ